MIKGGPLIFKSLEDLTSEYVVATEGKSPYDIEEDAYLANWKTFQKINQLTDGQAHEHIEKAREIYRLLTPLKEQSGDAGP